MRKLLPLIATLFFTMVGNAWAADCVCPFYYYGPAGGGLHYHYAYIHSPTCSDRTFTFDTFESATQVGNCADDCNACDPLGGVVAGDDLTTGDCTSCTDESKARNVSFQKDRGVTDETDRKFTTETVELPVPIDFAHEHFEPLGFEQDGEVAAFGEPMLLKYCPTRNCAEETTRYLRVLCYTYIRPAVPGHGQDDAVFTIAFGFESDPPESEEQVTGRLPRGACKPAKPRDGEPLTDKLFLACGGIFLVGQVRDCEEWGVSE